jgi:hypothetical protein
MAKTIRDSAGRGNKVEQLGSLVWVSDKLSVSELGFYMRDLLVWPSKKCLLLV